MGNQVSGAALWDWWQGARQRAIAAHIPTAELDWLLAAVGVDRLSLRLGLVQSRPQVALKLSLSELEVLWQQRLEAKVPVQYLIGETAWRNFVLRVTPAVLIPRPETELLIDLAKQAAAPELQQGQWADLGTGSGAIAIGLADAFPEALIHAVDRSHEALKVAQENAEQAGLGQRIRFYQGDWFAPIAPLLTGLGAGLSGVVSNPPYIPSDLLPDLQPEVFRHEPHLALDGGADGLDCIRHLVGAAPLYLRSGGIWLIEMMAGQAEAVAQLLQEQGDYQQIQIYPDLAGVDRFALAVRA